MVKKYQNTGVVDKRIHFLYKVLALYKHKLDNKSTKTKTVKQTKYKHFKNTRTKSKKFKLARSNLNKKPNRVFLYPQAF